MKLTNAHRWLMMLLAATLLAACADDDAGSEDIIRLRADVWQVMEGTRAQAPARSLSRATTYGNATDLQTEGSFTCTVYQENTTTAYIPATPVNWSDPEWLFSDGKHYWPATGALDFFAYMPSTKPDYITSISYTTARNPQFTCSLPMTGSDPSTISEFVYALTTGQNKTANASGVALTFMHPFARLNFQLSASHPDITIEAITFKSLKSGGTCSFDGSASTWSSLTPADKTVDFVATINKECHNNTAAVPLGTYLVVPQTFAGDITVKAKWTDWGEQISHNVSTTLPASINWQPGHSYTYTFTITETDLIVKTDKFTEQW